MAASNERVYWIGLREDLTTIKRVVGQEELSEVATSLISEGHSIDDIVVAEEREVRLKIAVTDPLKSGSRNGNSKANRRKREKKNSPS